MKTALGMVTFGNLEFTKMAIRSVLETSQLGLGDIYVVVGKPGDTETINWLEQKRISHTVHAINKGFPASINDIYDACWRIEDYDNLIVMGNDVIAYPYAIDSLIKVAEDTDYEWICAREYDVRALCREFPDARKLFSGDDYKFSSFNERPWDMAIPYSADIQIDEAGLSDVHNLSLFKRSVFDKIGYIDINFYPAYYEDNDYCRRAILTNIKSCTVHNAIYFHFWSRTFKQGSGGSTHKFFNNNKRYYMQKWGGDFLQEKWDVPFNGGEVYLAGIRIQPEVKIMTRENETELFNYWRSLVNAT